MVKPFLTCVVVAGTAAAFAAGCSKPSDEVPPSPSSAASNAPRPTEKGVIGNLPPRAFNANMNAADGIMALQSEGYSVQINWGGGRQDQPLSMCRIGGVDGLRGSGAVKPGTSVYVTVIC